MCLVVRLERMDDALADWGQEPEAELDAFLDLEQDPTLFDMAARYAPHIRLDNFEPFQPLVTGYSFIQRDGPSPSFERHIRLGTAWGRANKVIEYAIWWDWDINHLYELEHIWVYLGRKNEIIRVEGSWHGEVKDLSQGARLTFDNDHPVILAEPGKHAFGLSISAFKAYQNKVPEMTSRYAGAHGTFLTSSLKDNIRRTPPGDRLVQTYLSRFAFTPSWRYSQTPVSLENKLLVPWPLLRDWIPDRVNAWLKYLEQSIEPAEYRYLRTAVCYSIADINKARAQNLDVIQIGISRGNLGLPVMVGLDGKPTGPNMLRILKACWQMMIGHHLILHDARIIPWISRLLNLRDLSNYIMIGSENMNWLVEMKERSPEYRTVLLLDKALPDVVSLAQKTSASYVQITGNVAKELSSVEIRAAHQAGIGIIAGPVDDHESLTHLQSKGVDSIVVQDPTLFQN